MSENPYKAPVSSLHYSAEKNSPALWSPNTAGILSLLFSPVFGSYIIAKNWEALGEGSKQESAEKWLWASVGIMILSALASVIAFLYIIIWYFVVNRPQARYIKEKYPEGHSERGWKNPVLVALAINIVFISLIILALEHPPQIAATPMPEHVGMPYNATGESAHTSGNTSFMPDGEVCSTIANHTYCSHPNQSPLNADVTPANP